LAVCLSNTAVLFFAAAVAAVAAVAVVAAIAAAEGIC
jgi:hypothetical protein